MGKVDVWRHYTVLTTEEQGQRYVPLRKDLPSHYIGRFDSSADAHMFVRMHILHKGHNSEIHEWHEYIEVDE